MKNELYILVNNLLKEDKLIVTSIVKDILNINNISDYCRNNYKMGYKDFLKSYFNIDYDKYLNNNCMKIYKYCIENNIIFPNNFVNMDNFIIICKSIFNNNINENEFYETYSVNVFKKYKLMTFINKLNIKPSEIVKILYPHFKNYPFLFKLMPCPADYWADNDNIIFAINYMVNDMIKIIN